MYRAAPFAVRADRAGLVLAAAAAPLVSVIALSVPGEPAR
jgi:hypothetical protein